MWHRQLAIVVLLVTAACPSAAQVAGNAAPASQPAAAAPPTSQPAADPFARLRPITSLDKLPPIRSVRVRDQREEKDRSRKGKIRVSVNTRPKGATVLYGGKLMGKTPLTLTAKRGSTPLDVVIKARGYMTLRTRIRRKETRGYFFKLTPAKIR